MAKRTTETADTEMATSPSTWRSLAERNGSPSFAEASEREFLAPLPDADGVDRRQFMTLMGASMALGGLACAKQPLETIAPFVKQPEDIVPGRPLWYATAISESGYTTGVLVESHEGRPTKIDGNPEHPASLGRTTARDQAQILELYDPDRAQALTNHGRIRTWDQFVGAVLAAAGSQEATGGRGLRFLTRTVTSPALAAQIDGLLTKFPEARWYQYEAIGRQSARTAAAAALGEGVDFHYDVAAADVIVSLESDLLTQGPGSVRYAADFSARRKAGSHDLNRLYAIESSPTNTGASADHRLARSASQVESFAVALAAATGVAGVSAPSNLDAEASRWVEVIAKDLEANRGRGLVVAGDAASRELNVLALAINEALGNMGTTVKVTESVEATPADQIDEIRQLAKELGDGAVEVLFILDANPVYDAPADLDFTTAIQNEAAFLRVQVSSTPDETTPYCHWHVPMAHALETWGDGRAYDGTTTIQQPLIQPLYGGKSFLEVLAVVEGRPGVSAHDIVKEYWVGHLGDEKAWRRALHDGLVPESTAPSATATVNGSAVTAAATGIGGRASGSGPELTFRPDAMLYDGRFANNSWLQECPKPFTMLTWDNALLVSPNTARDLGVATSDVATITANGRTATAPVFVLPGQADGAVTLHLGYGRTQAGRVGNGIGVDAYALRTSDALWRVDGVSVVKSGDEYLLATTQEHHSMENRHLVRHASVAEYQEHPHFAHEVAHTPADDMTLYPPWPYEGYSWGMSINLSACTGCSACLVACQSENNIPVVGKTEVLMGREMSWIRIDRYFEGDDASPDAIYHQPVPCMHCENAPCEVVCPVAATVHSDEGLNDMVYNRCVGTRYCANNCPYKVRRFNFFKYQDWETPSFKLMRNPDVSVRFRGVMEKCTYCVQRINGARIAAHRDDRKIQDGDVVTACQQACPSGAIAFGDINDPDSEVRAWKELDLSYGLLEELNTRPRTTYLARITNPNPELEQHS